MAITKEEAIAELARRELARRGISRENNNASTPDYESKGLSGMIGDAFSGAGNALMGLPSALMNAPSEGYGAVKQLLTQPKRALQNIGGGFGSLGHGILSAPGNVRDYLQKKDIVSEDAPSLRLPESILPKEFNYEEALGRKGEQKGDTLLSGLPTSVATAPFASKLFTAVEKLPLSKTMSARPLIKAKELIKERGIKRITVSKDIFNEAKNFLPKSLPSKNLLNNAKTGSYNDLFTLQSDLGKISNSLVKSSSGAERLHGIEAGKLRQRLLDGMKHHLKNTGHKDIAEELTKGQNKYRKYMKIKETVKKVGIPVTKMGAAVYGYKKLNELLR